MPIKGQVNFITDPLKFFEPILNGGHPTTGFAPAKNTAFEVVMTGKFAGLIPIPLTFATVNETNGSFELPDPPGLFASVEPVWINMTLHNRPFYRTEAFPRAHAEKGINIFVFQPTVPQSAGVTAGLISQGLATVGLPGNTTLKANPWGLGIVGSRSGADIQFGLQMIPDTSPNLSIFFDLALDGWNIHVGWPADACTSADSILNSIRSSLQTAGSQANSLVLATISKAFHDAEPILTPALIQTLLTKVSIQFITMNLPNLHTWALSNHADGTVVVVPTLAVGWPRAF